MKKTNQIVFSGILSLSVLLSGCAGNVTTIEDSQTTETPEITSSEPQSSEPEAITDEISSSAPESSEPEVTTGASAPETTESSEEIPETPSEIPDVTGGYMADWIYGTWSNISVNGQDFWDYADEMGLDGEYQLVFDSTSCQRVSGSKGVDYTYTYQITDDGVVLYDEDMTVWCSFVYDPSKDTLTYSDGENYTEFKRGTNPRKEAGENYEAGWIYGTWSVISVDGQDFWEWADENDVSSELMLEFASDGVRALPSSDTSEKMKYRITDDGAVITYEYGDVVMTYDSSNDTLTMTDGGIVYEMKRGTNPRSVSAAE